MPYALRIIALSTVFACGTAHAMQESAWDFRGEVPAGTAPQNLTTVQITEEGLYVQTETDGFIQFVQPALFPDSVTITVTNAATPKLSLLWRTPDLGTGEFFQQNVPLPTGREQAAVVDLDTITEWTPDASALAIAFPAGSEVLVHSIEWRDYSFGEKIWNGVLSFWTTDEFRMYSINFLWGPLIGTSPEARAVLYNELPPRAWSATRLFYAVFALALVAALIARFADPVRGPSHMRAILLVTGAALWIVFDARMTQEIVTYAARDWSSYVLAPPGDRVLRSHATLYDVLEEIDALLGDDGRYVLVSQEGTPFFANVRYKLYPATPVTPAEAADTKAWVVLGMPGVTVKNGMVTAPDGTPLSAPGTVVKQFDDSSFFFRIP